MSNDATPTPAATVLLVRDAPEFQVLMVKRHHQIDFAGGALVFPGGKTHEGDRDPAWARYATGWEEAPADQRAQRIAAIREIYEEAGVLLARDAAGEVFHGDDRISAARDAVARDERPFIGLIAELDLRIDLTALTVFAHWIAPAIAPKRFDTWFFLAAANSRQMAVCDGGETVDAEWIAPSEALRLGEAGRRTLLFPTRMNLKLLAEASDSGDAVARARAKRLVTIRPEVVLRDGGQALTIPPDAGYGEAFEMLPAMKV